MPTPSYDTVRDIPLPTDTELVPHLQSLLANAYRRQVWITLLDDQHRPYPVLMPSDVDPEPDPDDALGFSELLRCLSLDFNDATVVTVFERPGPTEVTDSDRRWLRLLTEACVEAGCSFRGPYLLVGSTVLAVPRTSSSVYRGYTRGMATTPSTTIKVPAALRDRLNEHARTDGVTVAEVIEKLLRDSERAARFNAMRTAWDAQTPADRAEYAAEISLWEQARLEDMERREPPYE